MGRVPQQFQRPQMDMPTPGRQAAQAQDFWGSFSEMMDSSPENAWKYLSQAPQGASVRQDAGSGPLITVKGVLNQYPLK